MFCSSYGSFVKIVNSRFGGVDAYVRQALAKEVLSASGSRKPSYNDPVWAQESCEELVEVSIVLAIVVVILVMESSLKTVCVISVLSVTCGEDLPKHSGRSRLGMKFVGKYCNINSDQINGCSETTQAWHA